MEEEKKDFSVEELPENKLVEETPVVTQKQTKEEKEDLHGESLTDRVRVLSPGMMVAKRFFRSKLSVLGLALLIFSLSLCFLFH